MQISGLPVSTAFGASDVLAIEINGVTYKITGATLAAALQSMGDYVTVQDIANNLTTTDEGYVLDARQGKALLDAIEVLGAADVGAVAADQGAANAGKALVVGNDGNVTTGKTVRPDVAQTLTAAEQAQARGNIGAASATELAAEAAAREAADSDLKSAIDDYTKTTQKPNLFNKSDVIDGFYYGSNGNITPSDLWAYSPTYSEIVPNETYYGKYNNNGSWANATLAVAWYDADKTFLSQSYSVSVYDAPSNAKYVRISYRKDLCNLTIVFANFPATSEQGYGFNYSLQDYVIVPAVEELSNNLENVSDTVSEIDNITNYTSETEEVPSSEITIHDGYYIGIDGRDNGPYNNWQYAEYGITQNDISLSVTAVAGQNARLWELKDDNNTVIAYSTYSGFPKKFSETIDLSNYPTATRLFVNDSKSGSLLILRTCNKKIIEGENVYVNGESVSEIINRNDQLYGKVLCCVGDSITEGADMDAEGITNMSDITVYNCDVNGNFTQTTSGFLKTYGWQIADRHKMIFYNGGVSGSTMQGLSDKNGFSLANGRYTKLPDTLDYLLIWFGWNDAAYGTLGTITDETNESYCGGYNVVLPYLINKYPYAKIGLIVPFGATAGHREAVRLLGNKWGIAVWDNYQGGTPLYFGKESSVGVEESIVTANRAKFQANGAHPNFKGHRQLADMIEEWMKGI